MDQAPKLAPDSLSARYGQVREATEALCRPLQTEDFVVQPVEEVSPPKWHLGHTAWFFERLVLQDFTENYRPYHDKYYFIFNSYYDSFEDRIARASRSNASRPTVSEVFEYRAAIDARMMELLESNHPRISEIEEIVELGLNHEQQHQELLLMDMKQIFFRNPIQPIYGAVEELGPSQKENPTGFSKVEGGLQELGCSEAGFRYCNEGPVHKVYVEPFSIQNGWVTNADFLKFIEGGGYENHSLWLEEGWRWANSLSTKAPMFWQKTQNGDWNEFTLGGSKPLDLKAPVRHVSFYEADAYARFVGADLPTEAQYEIAAIKLSWAKSPYWHWTSSAYRPYPGYKAPAGALGEYNSKFMSSQMVMRGGAFATPGTHYRHSYRNFFYPHDRWQFSGIKLVQHD